MAKVFAADTSDETFLPCSHHILHATKRRVKACRNLMLRDMRIVPNYVQNPNHVPILAPIHVRHAEQQLAALHVGKRADALEPTRRVLALKDQFLVVRRHLADMVLNFQNTIRIPKSAPRRKADFRKSAISALCIPPLCIWPWSKHKVNEVEVAKLVLPHRKHR